MSGDWREVNTFDTRRAGASYYLTNHLNDDN